VVDSGGKDDVRRLYIGCLQESQYLMQVQFAFLPKLSKLTVRQETPPVLWEAVDAVHTRKRTTTMRYGWRRGE
jgi:hypothetical protein